MRINVTRPFRQTYEADERLAAYAMELVDSMAGWIDARVHAVETEAVGKVEVGEDKSGSQS